MIQIQSLLLHTCLSLCLSLLLSFLRFPSLLFHGLFSYIHPDNTSTSAPAIRKKPKSKPPSELDAQIFRIKLDSDHLQTRIFYPLYHSVSVLSFVTLSSLLLHLPDGSLIPLLLAFLSLSRLLFALAKVSFEKSASRLSDKRLCFSLGLLGFLFGIVLRSSILRSLLDFHFVSSLHGFWALFFAAVMGCLAGLLYMPALKSARAFWLGTDQIRCNLELISCGWFARSTLYLCCILNFFTALLWITPFMEIFINHKSGGGRLAGNVGMSGSDYAKFRLCCLLLSGVSQMIALRPNLQMYLNEAVLSWYQRLHASRIPDLDYSRAKVFLHNHYACLAILHMFIPPALVLVFLGLSQIEGRPLGKLELLCSQQPCFGFIKEAALFMAWWVVLVWSVFSSVTLVWYRRGFIYVS